LRIGRCARCGRDLKRGEPRIRVILKNGREVNKTYCMRCFDRVSRIHRGNINKEK